METSSSLNKSFIWNSDIYAYSFTYVPSNVVLKCQPIEEDQRLLHSSSASKIDTIPPLVINDYCKGRKGHHWQFTEPAVCICKCVHAAFTLVLLLTLLYKSFRATSEALASNLIKSTCWLLVCFKSKCKRMLMQLCFYANFHPPSHSGNGYYYDHVLLCYLSKRVSVCSWSIGETCNQTDHGHSRSDHFIIWSCVYDQGIYRKDTISLVVMLTSNLGWIH